MTEPIEPRNHSSYGPITKVLIAVAVVLSVSCGVLAYAVSEQGHRIDDLETQTKAVATQTQHLSDVADRITAPDPKQDAALKVLFCEIDALYQAVVIENSAATEGDCHGP